MTTIKKGRGETKPEKGQKIGCYYKGHFDNPDGKIFDQLQPKSRGSQPLSFKGKLNICTCRIISCASTCVSWRY